MEMQKLGLGIMKWYLMEKFNRKEECVNHVQKPMGLSTWTGISPAMTSATSVITGYSAECTCSSQGADSVD